MKRTNDQKPSSSRRDFIKNTSLSLAGISIVPRHVLGGQGFTAPSDMVYLGIVGVGGRGKNNLRELLKLDNVKVVALADPSEYWDLANFYYRTTAGRGPIKEWLDKRYAERFPGHSVKPYVDFEEMLERESNMDGILCATPDHTHAYVSIKSMRAGKHVYCEKPLTHNIEEARLIEKVAKETGLATQMGNQLHSTEGIRQTVEYLRAGVIGSVSEAHAWVGATRWIPELRGVPQPAEPIAVPKGLDWNLWIGPRKMREFQHVYAPVTWRDFWDFGCGAMGDFGCHDLDAAVWGLDLAAPTSVELRPAGYSDSEIVPYGEIGYYDFPATNSRDAVKMTWYSGGLRPPHHPLMPKDMSYTGRGALYIGEKGIMVYEGRGQAPRLFPESLEDQVSGIKPTLPPTKGHHADWIAAIQGGPEPQSNFGYASRLTEITLLGVLSLRLGGVRLDWDHDNMKVRGRPEADVFISEEIRPGWEMS